MAVVICQWYNGGMLDVGIAVALAVVTLMTAYLGVYVTLHPAESDRARLKYKLGFWACGVLAIGLIAWQASRNVQTQRELARSIITIRTGVEAVRKDSERPINVGPIQVSPVVSLPNTTPKLAASPCFNQVPFSQHSIQPPKGIHYGQLISLPAFDKLTRVRVYSSNSLETLVEPPNAVLLDGGSFGDVAEMSIKPSDSPVQIRLYGPHPFRIMCIDRLP